MSSERITDSGEAVRYVVEQAFLDEAHIMIPPSYKPSGGVTPEQRWQRDLSIMERFLLKGEHSTQIGPELGLSHQRINQIARTTFLTLWDRSLLDVREAIDPIAFTRLKVSSLDYRKHLSSIRGKSFEIIDKVSQGQSHAGLRKLGYSNEQIYGARTVARKLPEAPNIPYNERFLRNTRLAEDLKEAETDERKQELLNLVSPSFYKYQTENGLYSAISVSDILVGMNLSENHRRLKKLVEYLTQSGIPNASFKVLIKDKPELNYYFIHFSDIDRAEQAILASPEMLELFENPVGQVGGANTNILPKTTFLGDPNKYFRPGALMRELGLHPKQIGKLLDMDAPTPIYRSGKSLYADIGYKDDLFNYLGEKAREKGLIR